MGNQHRRARVEEMLRSFVASELLLNEEPMLAFLTITAAKVSPDLKHAEFYWCRADASPHEIGNTGTESVLRAVIPHLKKRIAKELNLRFVPSLKFTFDRTPFMSERINQLLKDA